MDPQGASEQMCPECDTPYWIHVFPGMLDAERAPAAIEKSTIEGDASCFFHASNKAVIPCSSCGRFLCSLCDIPFGEAHICPKCIERSQDSEKNSMKNQVYQYDNMALLTAILPALFFLWPALIGAPISLFITIKYFKTPCSILPRSKIRFYLAGLLALGEIALFIFFIAAMVYG